MSEKERGENYLTALRKALDAEFMEGWEIIEIDLTPYSHEVIKKHLENQTKADIHEISSLFGIPVVIDSGIPSDKFWVIRRKEKGE